MNRIKILLIVSQLFCGLYMNAVNHPLWVGYESCVAPRIKGLQGQIDKQLIEQYLPLNPIIVEAGAHAGIDTVEMAKMFKGSTIYAFEPLPFVFKQLEQRTRHLKNVIRFTSALSDKTGNAIFYVSTHGSDGSSSLLKPKEHLKDHPEVLFTENIRVDTVTLDDWAKKYNIEKIDFLWLDMQGSECAMLQASPTILKTVQVIITEVSITEQYENCTLYPIYRAWLESQGFEVIREDMPWVDGGNVLFVRKAK